MTRRTFLICGALVGLVVGGLVVLLVVTIIQTRALAGQIRATQQTNTGTVELIKDCTEPTGKCFQRGQKRTAATVADINKITLFAAACADREGEQRQTEIQACVLRRLTLADRRPVG